MGRFTIIILFLALSTYVTCSIITRDVPMKDAEEENSIAVPKPVPVAQVADVAKPEKACAKVGEFCISHKDCCSNGCLGYMRRCVSAREVEEDE